MDKRIVSGKKLYLKIKPDLITYTENFCLDEGIAGTYRDYNVIKITDKEQIKKEMKEIEEVKKKLFMEKI